MANEEIKKDEMNLESKETVNQEIPDEELDSIAGGAVYDDSGNMLTTPFIPAASGSADIAEHTREPILALTIPKKGRDGALTAYMS